MQTVEIPNRPVFRASEVCELADVQPYVLRTWEAEFPDLGVSKTANGPRLYRRADVERVLRIKHLILVEGLTLAGARRQLNEEQGTADDGIDADLAALVDGTLQQQLRTLRQDLRWILDVLSGAQTQASGDLPFGGAEPSGPSEASQAAPSGRASKKPRASKKR